MTLRNLLRGLVVVLVLSGCLSGCRQVGPNSIPRDRYNYGMSISESWKRQTLLNLVKIRYADSPLFVDIGTIVASYGASESLSAGAHWGRSGPQFPWDSLTLSGSGSYSQSPTITYSPLTSASFIRGLMTPVRPESVLLIIRSGWPVDSVLSTIAKSINGLQNQTYSVNGGIRADPRFIRVVELLRDLQLAELVEFRIVPKDKDSGELTFLVVIRTKDIPEQAALDEAELRRLLKLSPDTNEYSLVWGSVPADDREIAIQTRSVLQVLAVISMQAQLPECHVKEGRATPGISMPPSDPERVIRICSSKEPPADSYTAVPYEGYWFWIDDKDLQSKQTFSFLMLLFSLIETGGRPAAPPIITIPTR